MSEFLAKGFCVKCKKLVKIVKPRLTLTKNKRKLIKGTCPVCNVVVGRFVKNKFPLAF